MLMILEFLKPNDIFLKGGTPTGGRMQHQFLTFTKYRTWSGCLFDYLIVDFTKLIFIDYSFQIDFTFQFLRSHGSNGKSLYLEESKPAAIGSFHFSS